MEHQTYIDMHIHTTASDGVFTPAEIVQLAVQAGLSAIAITDHDTIAGVEEAQREGRLNDIDVIPGVEISTVARGMDIHILGYYINIRDQQFIERLAQLRNTRNIRNQLILNRLNELGIPITIDEVMEHLVQTGGNDQTIGRPHIADVLIAKGIVKTLSEAFELYLGRGGAAYMNPPRIGPAEAIQWIREAGGKAVLAHPGLYNNQEIVDEIIRSGLDGIEAYHSDHNADQRDYYADLAHKERLIVTAGSDFHGARSGVLYHGEIGSERMSTQVLHLLHLLRGEHIT